MRDKNRNLKFIAGAATLAGGLAAVLAWAAAGAQTAAAEPAAAKTVFVDKPDRGQHHEKSQSTRCTKKWHRTAAVRGPGGPERERRHQGTPGSPTRSREGSLPAGGRHDRRPRHAPARGGIGIVRVSGPATRAIAAAMLGAVPAARHATVAIFADAGGGAIDAGLALFFPAHFLHWRGRARTARPWRPAGHGSPGRARHRTRRTHGAAGGVHRARVPQRQAGPRTGGGDRRPDRRGIGRGGACGAAFAGGGILARSR